MCPKTRPSIITVALIALIAATGCNEHKATAQATTPAHAQQASQPNELLIKYNTPYIGVAPKVSKIYINGNLVTTFTETSPAKLPLKAGTYDIEIKAEGYTSLKEKIEIMPDIPQQIIYAPNFVGTASGT